MAHPPPNASKTTSAAGGFEGIRTVERENRYSQLLKRDPAGEGQFWCSVVTTGVYCRASCPARPARFEHVRFHNTLQDAQRTGFRPCLRCRPHGPSLREMREALVARAEVLVASCSKSMSSAEIATELGVSRGHFHKVLRIVRGETPRQLSRRLTGRP